VPALLPVGDLYLNAGERARGDNDIAVAAASAMPQLHGALLPPALGANSDEAQGARWHRQLRLPDLVSVSSGAREL
jgi:hypothetical protein